MKRLRRTGWFLLPILLGLATYLLTSAHTWSQAWAWVRSEPLLEHSKAIDLGEVELGQTRLARFTVWNRGGGELVLDQFQTNCACSQVEWERDGRFERAETVPVHAGTHANLLFRIAVRGQPGLAMSNVVRFRTNDPDQPEGKLEAVVTKITGGIMTTPRTITFGIVEARAEARQVLEVWDEAVTPRALAKVDSSDPERLSVRLLAGNPTPAPAKSRAGVLVGRIEVALRTDTPGSAEGKVFIHLDGPTRPADVVPVFGRVAGLVEAVPPLLVMPRASGAGSLYHDECVCRNHAGLPVTLTVDSAPPNVTVQMHPAEGNPNAVVVRVDWKPQPASSTTSPLRPFVRLRARVGEREADLVIPVFCRRSGGE